MPAAPPPAPGVVFAPEPLKHYPSPVARPGAPTVVDEVEEPDDGLMGSYQSHFYGQVGGRVSRVSSSAYDWFAGHDALASFALGIGRSLPLQGPWSAGLSLNWEYSGQESRVRGAPTELGASRFTLAPELRYHLLRRLYAYARVGAGVSVLDVRLDDDVTNSRREDAATLFTLDASLGAAVELFGPRRGETRAPRVWLLAEGGYLFTAPAKLAFANASEIPARSTAIEAGQLGLSGATLRAALGLTL